MSFATYFFIIHFVLLGCIWILIPNNPDVMDLLDHSCKALKKLQTPLLDQVIEQCDHYVTTSREKMVTLKELYGKPFITSYSKGHDDGSSSSTASLSRNECIEKLDKLVIDHADAIQSLDEKHQEELFTCQSDIATSVSHANAECDQRLDNLSNEAHHYSDTLEQRIQQYQTELESKIKVEEELRATLSQKAIQIALLEEKAEEILRVYHEYATNKEEELKRVTAAGVVALQLESRVQQIEVECNNRLHEYDEHIKQQDIKYNEFVDNCRNYESEMEERLRQQETHYRSLLEQQQQQQEAQHQQE